MGKVFWCFLVEQVSLEFDNKTCPYFEGETRLHINGSVYDSDEYKDWKDMHKNKDRYDTIDCRDFRITSSGYVFVQYEASCLDKDGKGKDFT